MKKLLLFALTILFIECKAELHFTFCDPATKELKVKNFGANAVDISTYRLCSSLVYQTLNAAGVTINAGDFNLAPSEEVHFTWTNPGSGFTPAMDDMGLYLPSGSFGSAANIVDFLEWGAGDQGREDVAVMAGLWIEDIFIPTPGPFYYIGNGIASGATEWSQSPPAADIYTGVRINEVDPDQPGADAAEFIELYGDANASLDSLVIVFFQGGAGDVAYAAYDLDGYSLDANGFFLLGNAGVSGVQLIFANNSLQNGADGIAIYVGDAADWPSTQVALSTNLVDAMVYGTNDPADTGLIAILTPGQSQLDDMANGPLSFSRVPDGGAPFITSTYVNQALTPGFTNVLPCSGGSLALEGGGTTLESCQGAAAMANAMLSGNTGTSIWYFITNANDTILESDIVNPVDLQFLAVGVYHIWSASYTGNIDAGASAPGQPIAGVFGDDCLALSTSFITITITDCTIANCDGAEVSVANNLTYVSVCSDAVADEFAFLNNSTATVNYSYVLTDFANNVLSVLASDTYDLNTLQPGIYHLFGVSHEGTLDPTTIEAGDAVTQILTSGSCIELSANDVTIQVTTCEIIDGCSELYISQYLEGSSNNKAIEIYNPTPFSANLDEYDLLGYFNGATSAGPVIALTGTLQPGDTYVIANAQASQALLDLADITGGIATFNGDDALVLTRNLVPIDVIGVVGTDPGNAWVFGTGSTMDKTLVRKPEINAPTTNWIQSQGQWLVNAIDDISNMGAHTAVACTSLPFVSFENTSVLVAEVVGTIALNVQAFNVSTPFNVTIDVTAGSALADEDYVNTFPITLTFDNANLNQIINVEIIDDLMQEGIEFFTLTLTANAGEVVVLNEAQTITIDYSDQSYPDYTIAMVRADADNNGLADSLNVYCTLAGIVHGINFNAAGTHFTIIEGAAGIKVFDADNNYGYTVAEGDSVRVKGQVIQFEGMTEFFPDSIHYVNSNHPLEVPTVITSLGEANESHMVRMNCVTLTNPSQWTNATSGFDVDITNGQDTVVMHIDLDTDIYGTQPPTGHFSVVGIGAQFDTSGAPYSEGYNFWPRYLADIFDEVSAGFTLFGDLQYGDDGATLLFENTSEGAATYTWNFGDGTTGTELNPNKFYTYEFLSTVAEITITLTVENGVGCTDTFSYTTDVVFVGVSELAQAVVKVFPNPTNDILNIQAATFVNEVAITDATGRIVLMENNMNTKATTIDVSSLSTGVYQALVTSEGEKYVIRLIIQ
jgi:Secretion system C-terminal sorting domain/Calx-beta domain/Lamin Tail Domain